MKSQTKNSTRGEAAKNPFLMNFIEELPSGTGVVSGFSDIPTYLHATPPDGRADYATD